MSKKIISYASTLFPNFSPSHSNSQETKGDGIYIVLKEDILDFLKQEHETIHFD